MWRANLCLTAACIPSWDTDVTNANTQTLCRSPDCVSSTNKWLMFLFLAGNDWFISPYLLKVSKNIFIAILKKKLKILSLS